MPSLIPGFEYDIFISYRQKDNLTSRNGLHDGWVTEFVENLRKELAATCKEEVSVYFDENPYDGIGDLHEVDGSLSSKLSCLIFIPIVSQTYCDPKCYAWSREFLYFKQLAHSDAFGTKVKLANGNVTSRIVPIRIHDLDAMDSALIEGELGGTLRTVDFIFRSPGVNRPLRMQEDHPRDNQEKTYYRDQVNKVANIVKDLIQSLQSHGTTASQKPASRISRVLPSLNEGRRAKALIVMMLIFAVAAYIIFRSNRAAPSQDRAAIAVLPFKIIGDQHSQYFADGVMDVILSNLSMFPELRVTSRTTVEQYRDNTKSIREIGQELNVTYILEGSAQKVDDDIRIVTRLINVDTDENIWSETFDQKFNKVFEVQNDISEAVARALQARLTPDIATRMNRRPTSNLEAYEFYLLARQQAARYASDDPGAIRDPASIQTAIRTLKKSLAKDSTFALAYAWLAGLKAIAPGEGGRETNIDSVILLATRALRFDALLPEANIVLARVYYENDNDAAALQYAYNALNGPLIDSVVTTSLIKMIGSIYSSIGDVDRALVVFDRLLEQNPYDQETLHLKFYALAADREAGELVDLADQIQSIDPEDPFIDAVMTHALLKSQNYGEIEKMFGGRPAPPDQTGILYVSAMAKNGKREEGRALLRDARDIIMSDPYLKAQLLLIEQKDEEALQLLEQQEIGWYNLALCSVNPVFDTVVDEERFKRFIQKNHDLIRDKMTRIHRMEEEGFLKIPTWLFSDERL